MVVAFIGNIGAGKTTLIKKIAAEFDRLQIPCRVEWESCDRNPFAKRYFEDPKRWAFHFQLFVLSERIKESQAYNYDETIVLQDRCYEEDYNVFAYYHYSVGNISKEEFDLLGKLKQQGDIRKPRLAFRLTTTPEECLSNIKLRGRKEEANIDLAFLERLDSLYEFNLAYAAKKCTINTSLHNFVSVIYSYVYAQEFLSNTCCSIALHKQIEVAEVIISIKEEMLSGRMSKSDANTTIEKFKQNFEAPYKSGIEL